MLGTFSQQIASLALVPGTGGAFEVSVDGNLVYSKQQAGRFPELSEVLEAVKPLLPD